MSLSTRNNLFLAIAASFLLLIILFTAQILLPKHPSVSAATYTPSPPAVAIQRTSGTTGITITMDPLIPWNGGESSTTSVPVTFDLHIPPTPGITNTSYYSIVLYSGDNEDGGWNRIHTTRTDQNDNLLVPSNTSYTPTLSIPLTRTGVHTIRATLQRIYINTQGIHQSEPVTRSTTSMLSDTQSFLLVPAVTLHAAPLQTGDNSLYVGQPIRFAATITPTISPDDPRDRFWSEDSTLAPRLRFTPDSTNTDIPLTEHIISGTRELSWTIMYSTTGAHTATATLYSGAQSVYGNNILLNQNNLAMHIITPSITLSIEPATTEYLYQTPPIEARATIPAHAAIGVTSTVRFTFGEDEQDTLLYPLPPGATIVTATRQYINDTDTTQTYPIQATLAVNGEQQPMVIAQSRTIPITVETLKGIRVVITPGQETVTLPNEGAATLSMTTHLEDTAGNRWIPSENVEVQLDTSFGGLDTISIDETLSASRFLLSSEVAGTATVSATYRFADISERIANTASITFIRQEDLNSPVREVLLDPALTGSVAINLDDLQFDLPNNLYPIKTIVKITRLTSYTIPTDNLGVHGFLIEVFDARNGVKLPDTDFPQSSITLKATIRGNDTDPPVIVATIFVARNKESTWEDMWMQRSFTPTALSQSGTVAYITSRLTSPGLYAILGQDRFNLYLPDILKN